MPTGDEPRSELMDGVFKVLTAHTKALAHIADHLEEGRRNHQSELRRLLARRVAAQLISLVYPTQSSLN